MAFDLDRFVAAQASTFDDALAELRARAQAQPLDVVVFPQLRGLGRSETSRFYGLDGPAEARAYLDHPVLGPRLQAAGEAILAASGDAVAILGPIDAMKLRSFATLFHRVAPDEPLFPALLDRFYAGMPDPPTDDLLAGE